MMKEIQNYIEKLLSLLEISYNDISIDISDSGSYVCNISSEDSRFLIGRDGENLKALNYIVKQALSQKEYDQKIHIMLDVNGYQEEKIKKIKAIAHMMAERSRFFKSAVELDPMNSFERHVIHEYIQDMDDLETESTGSGRDRRIVIKYKK
jgi:spoIIIJ-associated protein